MLDVFLRFLINGVGGIHIAHRLLSFLLLRALLTAVLYELPLDAAAYTDENGDEDEPSPWKACCPSALLRAVFHIVNIVAVFSCFIIVVVVVNCDWLIVVVVTRIVVVLVVASIAVVLCRGWGAISFHALSIGRVTVLIGRGVGVVGWSVAVIATVTAAATVAVAATAAVS